MGEINLSRSQKDALARVEAAELRRLVDHAIQNERAGELDSLPLRACGLFVSSKLDAFHQALTADSLAKSSRKCAETGKNLQRAGYDLTSAVWQMQQRLEVEEREGQLFYVDDHVMHPLFFSDHLSVRVSYRWRETSDDEWAHGSITFTHVVDTRPNFLLPAPNR